LSQDSPEKGPETKAALRRFLDIGSRNQANVELACEKFARDEVACRYAAPPRSLEDWEELARQLLPFDVVDSGHYTLEDVRKQARAVVRRRERETGWVPASPARDEQPGIPSTGRSGDGREDESDPLEVTLEAIERSPQKCKLLKFLAGREKKSAPEREVAKHIYKSSSLRSLRRLRQLVDRTAQALAERDAPLKLVRDEGRIKIIGC
jgi:hypothetical protein